VVQSIHLGTDRFLGALRHSTLDPSQIHLADVLLSSSTEQFWERTLPCPPQYTFERHAPAPLPHRRVKGTDGGAFPLDNWTVTVHVSWLSLAAVVFPA